MAPIEALIAGIGIITGLIMLFVALGAIEYLISRHIDDAVRRQQRK